MASRTSRIITASQMIIAKTSAPPKIKADETGVPKKHLTASEIAPIHTRHDVAIRIMTFDGCNEVFNVH